MQLKYPCRIWFGSDAIWYGSCRDIPHIRVQGLSPEQTMRKCAVEIEKELLILHQDRLPFPQPSVCKVYEREVEIDDAAVEGAAKLIA